MRPAKTLLTLLSMLSLVGAIVFGLLGCGIRGWIGGLEGFAIPMVISIILGWLSRKVNF